MLNRITPPGKTSPGNPNTSSTVFHSPAAAAFWPPVVCVREIVGSETRRMTTAAKVHVLIDDSFVFFIDSSNSAMMWFRLQPPSSRSKRHLYSMKRGRRHLLLSVPDTRGFRRFARLVFAQQRTVSPIRGRIGRFVCGVA